MATRQSKINPAVDYGQLYFCADCGNWFAAPVRYCPECDHHYPEQECGNCHRDNSNIEQAKARDAEDNA